MSMSDDSGSLDSVKSVDPSPVTLTKLVTRLRLLVRALLPAEVNPEEIEDPTGLVNKQVIDTIRLAAGDFVEALPYCLLRARADFLQEASNDHANYDENFGRAVACEVLAEAIMNTAPPERLPAILSKRYQHREMEDMFHTPMSNALELAIDGHCTIFLSSGECQDVVNALWKGKLIQINNPDHDVDYVEYTDIHPETGYWSRVNPARMSVPRYQSLFRTIVWLLFLFVYSQAVREPLKQLDRRHSNYLDEWEILLYTMALGFWVEDLYKIYQLFVFVTWRAFSFWHFVSFTTNILIALSFTLRMIGLSTEGQKLDEYHFKSFQTLSFIAPLIWMKLVTIFDGNKMIGSMQLCIAPLYALDASDGDVESVGSIASALFLAVLGDSDFDYFSESTTGLALYYVWGALCGVILLNFLISLFTSAYEEIVGDAEAQFLAFFAGKTVSMIRAPDVWVYPAPYNLIELLVAPTEYVLSAKAYAKLNQIVMTGIFIWPILIIALYEHVIREPVKRVYVELFSSTDQGDAIHSSHHNPQVTEQGEGGDEDEWGSITTISFKELIEAFPDTTKGSDVAIMKELSDTKRDLKVLEDLLGRGGLI